MFKLWRILALPLALSLLAAGCGSDDESTADEPAAEATADETTDTDTTDDDADEPAATDGAVEKPEITLGLIPIADVAPVFIGIERGLFEAEGLTVTTEFAAGGAAAIPAVVSGDIDLAFGAYPSALSAIQAGLSLQIATEAVRAAPLFGGLYSLPDSGIDTPADMAGTTVAVNTLNNLVQIAVEAQLVDAGLSLDDVTLVEIPFPDMVAALELGDVDVISVVEPFGTIARNTLDAHLVTDMFAGGLQSFPVAGFYVTQEWAAENPNTLAAFNRAFAAATQIAANEEGALAAILPTYTSASPEAAAALNYPDMVAGIDADFLQIVADFMSDQSLLDEPLTVADYVIDNPGPLVGGAVASQGAASSDEDDEAAAPPEKPEITLGLIPIADVAPVFIGIERGLFEAEGLTVTTEFAAGGAAAIPAVVSGDIDLAFGAYPSALSAIQAGLSLQIATEAVRAGPLFAGLYSLPDSGIDTPADMAGTTVAVNTLNNIVQIVVEAQLVDAGLSLDDVTLVEIPFPDMVAALELGDVDVISVVEPFGTIARNTLDAHLVTDMFAGRLANFPVAGFYVTQEWAAENPNTLAAFNRAFAAATDIAANEEGALAAIVPTYTSASPEAAAALNYPNMVAGIDADFLQIVADFMLDQGLLDEPIAVADHLAG